MTKSPTASLRIRLLGAPGTGKTQLAAELLAALSARQSPARPVAIDDTLPLPSADPHPAGPTLLMGLDLTAPSVSCELQQAADCTLRDALAQSGIDYQVVYGQGAARLRNAMNILQAWLPDSRMAAQGQPSQAQWVWACDNCSDPQCERRLLSDLLTVRALGPSA